MSPGLQKILDRIRAAPNEVIVERLVTLIAEGDDEQQKNRDLLELATTIVTIYPQKALELSYEVYGRTRDHEDWQIEQLSLDCIKIMVKALDGNDEKIAKLKQAMGNIQQKIAKKKAASVANQAFVSQKPVSNRTIKSIPLDELAVSQPRKQPSQPKQPSSDPSKGIFDQVNDKSVISLDDDLMETIVPIRHGADSLAAHESHEPKEDRIQAEASSIGAVNHKTISFEPLADYESRFFASLLHQCRALGIQDQMVFIQAEFSELGLELTSADCERLVLSWQSFETGMSGVLVSVWGDILFKHHRFEKVELLFVRARLKVEYESFFGDYIRALIQANRTRRALFLVQYRITCVVSLEVAQGLWRLLLLIWDKRKLQKKSWRPEEGIKSLQQLMDVRLLPLGVA